MRPEAFGWSNTADTAVALQRVILYIVHKSLGMRLMPIHKPDTIAMENAPRVGKKMAAAQRTSK